jgi:anti-anti-sigma regulatory factor
MLEGMLRHVLRDKGQPIAHGGHGLDGHLDVQIQARHDGLDWVLLRVEGKFNYPLAKGCLPSSIGRLDGQHGLEVDLRQTESIDSAALGALLHLHQHLACDLDRAIIRCRSSTVCNKLKLAGMNRFFTVITG